MQIALYTIDVLFLLVCVLLILLVLIQKGRGGGLASAFGGVGGHTAFGSKTGDVLTWATAVLFGVFLILAVVANLTFNRANTQARAGVGASAPVSTPAAPSQNTPGPVAPGSPESNLPQAPVTADPGVSNPPPPAPDPNIPATPAPNPKLTNSRPTTRP